MGADGILTQNTHICAYYYGGSTSDVMKWKLGATRLTHGTTNFVLQDVSRRCFLRYLG